MSGVAVGARPPSPGPALPGSSAAHRRSLPRKKAGGRALTERGGWFRLKGKGQLSSADAVGSGLRAGRCLADTELTPVASYC